LTPWLTYHLSATPLQPTIRAWRRRDIRRFNRLDELAAIVGLVPGIYQSSDNKINLGLTKEAIISQEVFW